MSRLIVPTDYSATAERALDQTLLLAQHSKAEVELLHIVAVPYTSDSRVLDYLFEGEAEELQKLEALASRRLAALGLTGKVRCRSKVVFDKDFAEGLIRHFEKVKAKLVVMGTTGVSGLANQIFGSNTGNLISRSALPVLAIPPEWEPKLLKKLEFLVTPDELNARLKAVEKWAAWFGAEVSLTYLAKAGGDEVVSELSQGLFPLKVVQADAEKPIYESLVDYSQQSSGAICMFVHERLTLFERIFDKSITTQVAGRVEVPVLAIPI